MKLSIIICVYNTDCDYLDKCLNSLTSSTLGNIHKLGDEKIEYEIIFVDDGSSVDYTEIREKYQVCYTKTENRGIFSARALGVDLATGDYIAFCDSDDTVSFNYHLPMLIKAMENSYDIVLNDWAFHTVNARYYCKNDSSIKEDFLLFDGDVLQKFIRQAGKEHSYYVLWNKLYKREILKGAIDLCREYIPDMRNFSYSEDALINFFAHFLAKSIVNIHTGYYFYRIHDSQTVTVASEGKLLSHIKCMTKTLDIMEKMIEKREDKDKLLPYLISWRKFMCRTHFSHARANGYKALYKTLKDSYGVSRLKKARYSDGKAYHKNKLIGMNIVDIDNTLLEIFKSGGATLKKVTRGSYTERSLTYLGTLGCKIIFDNNAPLSIPKESISLKRRILLHPFVYNLGMLLFPKGSRIRAFLKRKI